MRIARSFLAFADICSILTPDRQTEEIYAAARAQLKALGRPIPENDVWIAALCLQWDLPLLTRDAHFTHVKGLTVRKFTLE